MRDTTCAAVRRAVPSDGQRVRACVDDAYSVYLDRMDHPPAPMLDDYAALIAQEVVFVATLDEIIVGDPPREDLGLRPRVLCAPPRSDQGLNRSECPARARLIRPA